MSMGHEKDREGAQRMDRIAKTAFAPVYPVIAEQILDRCGISRGRCLDVGSGPGSLGIALARASDLAVTLLDSSPDMLAAAEGNIREAGLSGRFSLLRGDVHAIPLLRGRSTSWSAAARSSSGRTLPGRSPRSTGCLRPAGRPTSGAGSGPPNFGTRSRLR
ncbi:Methyltransferase type 11 (fragment) [Methanoculleus bourgensis]|uniref:Methyltransferase type 11 n=1 Tax=Methanoculleus bourgensis TaxID=83986 RepID=A0A0X3BGF5_9EURY